MSSARNWTLPSPMQNDAPPGCRLLNPQSIYQFASTPPSDCIVLIGMPVPDTGKFGLYAPFQPQSLGIVSPAIKVLESPSVTKAKRIRGNQNRPNIPTELPAGYAGLEPAGEGSVPKFHPWQQ